VASQWQNDDAALRFMMHSLLPADTNYNMSVTAAEPEIQSETKSSTKTKTVYFIRHGESEYNAFKSRKSTWFTCRCWCCCDPHFQDPRLSAKGKTQVLALQSEVAKSNLANSVQLIYVSPLTRAIETCVGAFSSARPPIVVSEQISEVLDTLGDIGRPPEELAREFTDLSFEKLPSVWWFHDSKKGPLVPVKESATYLRQRQNKFLAELAGRPEHTIAVVGHSAFIKHITISSSKLPNCAIMKTALDVITLQFSEKEVVYAGSRAKP